MQRSFGEACGDEFPDSGTAADIIKIAMIRRRSTPRAAKDCVPALSSKCTMNSWLKPWKKSWNRCRCDSGDGDETQSSAAAGGAGNQYEDGKFVV
ncbi:MAG: hypothetical protein ACLR8P_14170 [Clostridium fessum]